MRRRSIGGTRRTRAAGEKTYLDKTRPSTTLSTLVLRWRVLRLRQKIFLITGLFLTMFSLYALSVEIKFVILPVQTMYPRVIRINEKFKRRSTSAELYDSIKRKVEPLSTVKVQENRAQNLENGDCKAMHDWQLTYQPACNNIHEINMNDNKFLAQGGFRSVWAMLDGDGSEAVIKTLVWRKEFREKEKDRHRRDATVYMMLQDSKHIPNIYGYCKSITCSNEQMLRGFRSSLQTLLLLYLG